MTKNFVLVHHNTLKLNPGQMESKIIATLFDHVKKNCPYLCATFSLLKVNAHHYKCKKVVDWIVTTT